MCRWPGESKWQLWTKEFKAPKNFKKFQDILSRLISFFLQHICSHNNLLSVVNISQDLTLTSCRSGLQQCPAGAEQPGQSAEKFRGVKPTCKLDVQGVRRHTLTDRDRKMHVGFTTLGDLLLLLLFFKPATVDTTNQLLEGCFSILAAWLNEVLVNSEDMSHRRSRSAP